MVPAHAEASHAPLLTCAVVRATRIVSEDRIGN